LKSQTTSPAFYRAAPLLAKHIPHRAYNLGESPKIKSVDIVCRGAARCAPIAQALNFAPTRAYANVFCL